jgi:hypothetical protein
MRAISVALEKDDLYVEFCRAWADIVEEETGKELPRQGTIFEKTGRAR